MKVRKYAAWECTALAFPCASSQSKIVQLHSAYCCPNLHSHTCTLTVQQKINVKNWRHFPIGTLHMTHRGRHTSSVHQPWSRGVHGDGILVPSPSIPADFTPNPTRPHTDSDPSPQKVRSIPTSPHIFFFDQRQ